MKKEQQKFFICKHCGNIIGMIFASGVPVVCCGEPMQELVAGMTDGAYEKHLPVVKRDGNKITVEVGSVAHPMIPEHYIMWIYLETEKGGQRISLDPGQKPEAVFCVTDDNPPVAAYEYCNLHGLWKTEIK